MNTQPWTDPRPDIAADSELWRALLCSAYLVAGRDPRGLFMILHGFRCCGAGLRLGRTTVILEPGEIPPAEYAGMRRRWLEPHAKQLRELLAAAAVRARAAV